MARAGNSDAIDPDSSTLSYEKMVLGGDVLVHAPVRSPRGAIEASPGKRALAPAGRTPSCGRKPLTAPGVRLDKLSFHALG
jgi:hypothetical protein